MRRSLCPSQFKKTEPSASNGSGNGSRLSLGGSRPPNGDVTITTLPFLGCLEIPDNIKRQFKIPSGCVITKESIALRKVKTLGPQRNFQVLRPGQSMAPLPTKVFLGPPEDDDSDEENLPTSVSNVPPFEPLVLWTDPNDPTNKIEVIPEMCCKLRPHQREGVQFLFECTMGLRGFEGQGCILADDMGLGKTFMSITLIWTLLNQGFVRGESAARKVIVACPTSLVGNWDNEIKRWIGDKCNTFPVKSEPKRIIQNFLIHRGKGVLIISYETQRRYQKMFEGAAKKFATLNRTSTSSSASAASAETGIMPAVAMEAAPRISPYNGVCELLICDEAHKLKNAESGLSKSLGTLPARRRVLLSGTPMQNDLGEFYNMVNFCNPLVLGTVADFKKRFERPILRSREPDASEKDVDKAKVLQRELSTIVNEFILKRGNILNAKHLPPKLVQFVCCRLTPLQERMYDALLNSKEIRHCRDGKQTNTLNCIRQLINICSHPQLIMENYHQKIKEKEPIDEDLQRLVDQWKAHNASSAAAGLIKPSIAAIAASHQKTPSAIHSTITATRRGVMPAHNSSHSANSSHNQPLDPDLSGKLLVLYRMMQTMRAMKQGERIVVVSNYTSTLDLIEQMCSQEHWPVHRLDGTTAGAKRTKLVDTFNDLKSNAFAFLLSSKAGGCGINLIGGNRLVLFDPDWNPASDKQAAGRIWREGQQRRCFIYRFMSTGSIEEKIIQRQLSKEGLQNIVDNTEQVNVISTDTLKQLFTYRGQMTPSDTHDTLACKRCKSALRRLQQQQQSAQLQQKTISIAQQQHCVAFITEFVRDMQAKSLEINRIILPTIEEVLQGTLLEELHNGKFTTVPQFSKRLRDLIRLIDCNPYEIDTSDVEAAVDVHSTLSDLHITDNFVQRWTDCVPELTRIGMEEALMRQKQQQEQLVCPHRGKDAEHGAHSDDDGDEGGDESDEDDDGEETGVAADITSLEQDGCPDEADFNKWSHHCGVETCDDELLKKAMADDTTISFIFGLEVNFDLLMVSEAAKREERELKKAQMEEDIKALNEKRQLEKRRSIGGADAMDLSDDEQAVGVAVTKGKGKAKATEDGTNTKPIAKKATTKIPVSEKLKPVLSTRGQSSGSESSGDFVDSSDSSSSDSDIFSDNDRAKRKTSSEPDKIAPKMLVPVNKKPNPVSVTKVNKTIVMADTDSDDPDINFVDKVLQKQIPTVVPLVVYVPNSGSDQNSDVLEKAVSQSSNGNNKLKRKRVIDDSDSDDEQIQTVATVNHKKPLDSAASSKILSASINDENVADNINKSIVVGASAAPVATDWQCAYCQEKHKGDVKSCSVCGRSVPKPGRSLAAHANKKHPVNGAVRTSSKPDSLQTLSLAFSASSSHGVNY